MRLVLDVQLGDLELPAEADEVVVRLQATEIKIKMPSNPEYDEDLISLVAASYAFELYGQEGSDWSMQGIAARANTYLDAEEREPISPHLVGHVLRSLGFGTRRSSQFNGRYVPQYEGKGDVWAELSPLFRGYMTKLTRLQGQEGD